MTLWQDIVQSFKDVLESDIVRNATISYKQLLTAVDLTKRSAVPRTLHHGAYSVLFAGHQAAGIQVAGEVRHNFLVQLQLAYEISSLDDLKRYTDVINDLTIIIEARIVPSSFAAPIENVTHMQTFPFQFTGQADSQDFGIIVVQFLVVAVSTT